MQSPEIRINIIRFTELFDRDFPIIRNIKRMTKMSPFEEVVGVAAYVVSIILATVGAIAVIEAVVGVNAPLLK